MSLNQQYLTFELNGQQYGAPIMLVREINRITETTPIPRTPVYVEGVMNLRGKVIPVINLRLKLGMSKGETNQHTCIIVVETPNGLVGAIVDKVFSVVEFRPEQLEAPPNVGSKEHLHLLGMGKLDERVVILLDLLKLFETDGVIDASALTSQAA